MLKGNRPKGVNHGGRPIGNDFLVSLPAAMGREVTTMLFAGQGTRYLVCWCYVLVSWSCELWASWYGP